MNPLIVTVAMLIGAPEPTPAELVKQLGDKSFKVREAAADQLVRLGKKSVPELTAGLKNPDAEISEQCRKLLPRAINRERDEKLATLVKDPKSAPPKDLIWLEAFLKTTGDSKAARELYSEMFVTHYEAIEALEKDPKQTATIYNKFRFKSDINQRAMSLQSCSALFMFLIGDDRYKAPLSGDGQVPGFVLPFASDREITTVLSGGDWQIPQTALFLNWFAKETNEGKRLLWLHIGTSTDSSPTPSAMKLSKSGPSGSPKTRCRRRTRKGNRLGRDQPEAR